METELNLRSQGKQNIAADERNESRNVKLSSYCLTERISIKSQRAALEGRHEGDGKVTADTLIIPWTSHFLVSK